MLDIELLLKLLSIEATPGDEDRMAAWLVDFIPGYAPEATLLQRIGNTVLAQCGQPRTAVFAHLDTVGFTQGYDNRLIPAGSPQATPGVRLRSTQPQGVLRGQVAAGTSRRGPLFVDGTGFAGARWVYDTTPQLGETYLRAAYLDNRMGVLTALQLLREKKNVLVAFTAAEEVSGRGALEAAHWICAHTPIRQALIADVTWATAHVVQGKGPAVSMRDAYLPRKVFFDRVAGLAQKSGLPFQIEIEEEGSSDGGALERSGLEMDWLFVGAPETGYHSAVETLRREDAENMLRLYLHLTDLL